VVNLNQLCHSQFGRPTRPSFSLLLVVVGLLYLRHYSTVLGCARSLVRSTTSRLIGHKSHHAYWVLAGSVMHCLKPYLLVHWYVLDMTTLVFLFHKVSRWRPLGMRIDLAHSSTLRFLLCSAAFSISSKLVCCVYYPACITFCTWPGFVHTNFNNIM
jgi:hypothetical protein